MQIDRASTAVNEKVLRRKAMRLLTNDDSSETLPSLAQNPKVNTTGERDYVDFFVMGFAKCGTSSLMHLFEDVLDETQIVPKVFPSASPEYSFHGAKEAKILMDRIQNFTQEYPQVKKFGIKWPKAIRDTYVINDLIEADERNKNTKIILGLRHPVKWFESFYNYRMLSKNMPPPYTLIGGSDKALKGDGVFTGHAQYETYFMKFGKVNLNETEFSRMAETRHDPAKAFLSIPNKIFLYTVEQFQDTNSTRANSFLGDLQSFMELEKTITMDEMPFANSNKHGNGKSFIDICDDAFAEVREVLVENGKVTADWFLTRLAEPIKDVTIGGKEHFFSLLETWKVDPCSYAFVE